MTTISPISNQTMAGSEATRTAQTGLGENLDSFLKMLTTQLKNQDPLSPLDTNQFTQQLVSFSQVEQAIKTNDRLASLVSLMSSTNLASSVGVIGKQVEVDSAAMGLVEDGSIEFSYTLPSTSKATALTITDQAGAIVWTGTGELDAGKHSFTWDGTDQTGKKVPPGTYRLEVGAERMDGTPMTVGVTSFGVVDGIVMKEGIGALAFGSFEIPTSKLVAIR